MMINEISIRISLLRLRQLIYGNLGIIYLLKLLSNPNFIVGNITIAYYS